MAVERKTRLRGAQVLDKSIEATDLSGVGEIAGFVATVQADETVAYVDTTSLAGVNTNSINIVLNAFRIAINGSLTQFNMVDGIVDEYEDESGIDTGTSTNESYDSVNDLYSPSKPSISASPFTHLKLENNTDDGTGANVFAENGTPTYTAGHLNNALTLNGSTQFLDATPMQIDIENDTTGSFSIWFNQDVLGGTLFSISDQNVNTVMTISINLAGTFVISFTNVGSIKWSHSGGSTSTGTWFHIVVVHDGVSPRIYLDGTDITSLGSPTDATQWLSDISAGLDIATIGASFNTSSFYENFIDGRIDDFRYYQNTVLTQSDVDILYNSGIGTEDTNPEGIPDNMTLQSNSFTAEAQADNARIVLFEEDVDSITLNTDLKAFASRDGGTTFTQITLVNEGEYESGRNILSASVDISAQPAGTSMIYKIETLNNKDLKIAGVGYSWD